MDRCGWAVGESLTQYHDVEWGTPQHDDRVLFEFLVLEGAQAGLSWVTILRRRDEYRRAFSGFDPRAVSRYGEDDVERLMHSKIVRNRKKINSAVNNARRFVEVQDEFGTFDRFVWGFVDRRPVQNGWLDASQVPASTDVSQRLSSSMRSRGFTFVGPVICYAFMQAVGMVNDHTYGCFRYGKN